MFSPVYTVNPVQTAGSETGPIGPFPDDSGTLPISIPVSLDGGSAAGQSASRGLLRPFDGRPPAGAPRAGELELPPQAAISQSSADDPCESRPSWAAFRTRPERSGRAIRITARGLIPWGIGESPPIVEKESEGQGSSRQGDGRVVGAPGRAAGPPAASISPISAGHGHSGPVQYVSRPAR